MTDERLDHIEQMMEQLIEITSNTNATVSTLDKRMDILEQRIDNLMSQVATKNDIELSRDNSYSYTRGAEYYKR